MGVIDFEYPILQHFFCLVEKRTGIPAQPLEPEAQARVMAEQQQREEEGKERVLPKGVVLGPDGKPYALSVSYTHLTLPTKRIV